MRERSYLSNLAFGGPREMLGGKGQRLSELLRSGFPVPDGFVLTTSVYEEFVAEQWAMGTLDPLQMCLQLPQHLVDAVLRDYRVGFGAKVAVRSSATVEDSPTTSFAGVYDTILDTDESGLLSAIGKIYQSVLSEHSRSYLAQNSVRFDDVKMAVIVQRQIAPTFSGVCFTADPVSGDPEVILEFVRGRTDGIMPEQSSPFRVRADADFRPLKHTAGTAPQEFMEIVGRLLRVCRNVRDYFGNPQDIEWVLDKNGRPYILQSRDITALPIQTELKSRQFDVGHMLAQGIGVSRGMASGRIRRILSELSDSEVSGMLQEGDIAACYNLRVEHLAFLSKCVGVVMAEGSILSHAAIRTRELGIPAVGGVIDALALGPDGMVVTIDGNTGGVFAGDLLTAGADDTYNGPASSLFSGACSPIPVVYSPSRTRSVVAGNQTILFDSVPGGAIVYIDDFGDDRKRSIAVDKVACLLQISPAKVTVDEHGLWEGGTGPSVVYDQYMTIEYLTKTPATAALFAEGVMAAKTIDVERLRAFVGNVDAEAQTLFRDGMILWQEAKIGNSADLACQAAAQINRSRVLVGDLVGMIVDVYSAMALEVAAHEAGVPVEEILAGAAEIDAGSDGQQRGEGKFQV